MSNNSFLKQLIPLITAEVVAQPIMRFTGDAMGSFFGQRSPGPTGPDVEEGQRAGLGGAVRDAVYRGLTEEKIGSKKEGFTGGRKADNLNVRPHGTEAGRYITNIKRHSENPVMDFLYSSPEAVATTAGLAAPAALAIGAGYGFGELFGGSKPRSDYALAVQQSAPFGGTGNQNIDAAQASAYYQQQTAQMKFEHQMALQRARQDAQTPTNQPGSVPIGMGATAPALGVAGSIPGMDADLVAIGRSIYGSGLRA
jgi:hypothetical protein